MADLDEAARRLQELLADTSKGRGDEGGNSVPAAASGGGEGGTRGTLPSSSKKATSRSRSRSRSPRSTSRSRSPSDGSRSSRRLVFAFAQSQHKHNARLSSVSSSHVGFFYFCLESIKAATTMMMDAATAVALGPHMPLATL